MLNFGASSPQVKGGRTPGAPPGSAPVFRWNIDMCIMNYELLEHHLFNTLYTLHRPHIWKVI